MLKNHPKGLIVAFFTNMGERFGFYTMMAILVLFLQVKYGLDEKVAGDYYSWFYFAIYALSLLGGILADWKKQYKTVILYGQIIMFVGYVMMAIPSMSLYGTLGALLVISLGNGFFKGNLQAVVGQLYDDPKYAKFRDSAFMVFYMGINVGAFFAPFVATGIRNWWLETNGFIHDGSLPALCHQMINGTLKDPAQFQVLANNAILSKVPVTDLTAFAHQYLDVFSRGYNWAFAIAAVAMIVSLSVYVIFNKLLPNKSIVKAVDKQTNTIDNQSSHTGRILVVSLFLMAITTILVYLLPVLTSPAESTSKIGLGLALGLFVAFVSYIFQMSTKEERPRVISLILVFIVVIFFWMSFHQNGLTLTLFARDYTVKEVGPFTNLFFNLESLLCVIATIAGMVLMFRSKSMMRSRVIGAGLTLAFGAACYYFISNAKELNPISPEIFQAFNPLFIVALTPVVMGFFSFLSSKGKEPSTPRKIGFGMIIAASAFIIVLVGSLHLVSPHLLDGAPTPATSRISPYWLMSSYLILTIAELFLSPMGLSFVSKVAPPRFQGLMQGGWLLATAVGNKLLFIGSTLWGRVDLYVLWGVFFICCIISATFIFAMMRRLEKVTK
ncbi:MAG TPA: peptide MFS transporter [Paludibacteraceae bacterium]|nr:peptide MFS transporter [Paludibacteraceae bacterium]